MKPLPASSALLIAKRMSSESSIDVCCHPDGCGIRSTGSVGPRDSIEESGGETCLHTLILGAAAPRFGAAATVGWAPATGVPVTALVQPGAANSVTAAMVADKMQGNRIGLHLTFVSGAVKCPTSATETRS